MCFDLKNNIFWIKNLKNKINVNVFWYKYKIKNNFFNKKFAIFSKKSFEIKTLKKLKDIFIIFHLKNVIKENLETKTLYETPVFCGRNNYFNSDTIQ